MVIYQIDGIAPRIDAEAYVHPDAVIIGDGTIGPESTIWPGTVLRGDWNQVQWRVGARRGRRSAHIRCILGRAKPH
jgi:carbonic anhydrase/acetyltransferase-like protein (isoleucine patch superfamily)